MWPTIEIKSTFYVLRMKIHFYLFLQNDVVRWVTKAKAKSHYKVQKSTYELHTNETNLAWGLPTVLGTAFYSNN